jgi:hypothetical protein
MEAIRHMADFFMFYFRQDPQDFQDYIFIFLTSRMEVRKLNPLSAE